MMGAERRSLAMSEEEKKLTAYHEGRPRARRHLTCRRLRSDPQGDDHSARPRAGHGDAPAGTRSAVADAPEDAAPISASPSAAASPKSWSSATRRSRPARRATSSRRPAWRAPWSRASACPTSSARSPMRENQEEVFLGHSCRAPRTSRKPRRRRSTRKSAASSTTLLRPRDADPDRTPRPDLNVLARGPARIRDADGRRDHGAAQGHSAGPHAL